MHHHHEGWGGGGGWGGGREWGRGERWGHPNYYGGGGGGGLAFVEGMAVASMVSSATRPSVIYEQQQPTVIYEQQQPTVIYQQAPPPPPPASTVDYQARADAEAARRAAEMALSQQQQQHQQEQALERQREGLVLVKVKVPYGVSPGQTFSFSAEGREFSVTCPSNVTGGDEMSTYVPLRAQATQTAVETSNTASVGRSILREALSDNGGGRSGGSVRAVLMNDHVVVDADPENLEYNIISGNQGDVVTILEGTIEGGMRPPFQEYCSVQFNDGRRGKVSKYILKPISAGGPPPAQKQ